MQQRCSVNRLLAVCMHTTINETQMNFIKKSLSRAHLSHVPPHGGAASSQARSRYFTCTIHFILSQAKPRTAVVPPGLQMQDGRDAVRATLYDADSLPGPAFRTVCVAILRELTLPQGHVRGPSLGHALHSPGGWQVSLQRCRPQGSSFPHTRPQRSGRSLHGTALVSAPHCAPGAATESVPKP